jgi:HSP20 family protein
MESMFRPSVPAVDLVEREKEYVVTAELPGLDEKALELKLSGDTLSIRGQKQEERKEEHESYRLSERRYGSFHTAALMN